MLQCKISDVQTMECGSVILKAHDVEMALYDESSVEVPKYEIIITDPVTRNWLEVAIGSNDLSTMQGGKIHVDEKNQQVRILTQVMADITSTTNFVCPGIIAAPIHDVERLNDASYKLKCGTFNIVLSNNAIMFLAFTICSGSPYDLDGITCYVDNSNQSIAINGVIPAMVKSNFTEIVSPR